MSSSFKIDLKKAIQDLGIEIKGSATRAVKKAVLEEAGDRMIELIRGYALTGVSPISGNGKFPAYRGSYRDRIKRGQIPGKSLTPVNLELTGDFLTNLTREVLPDKTLLIGFDDELSQKKEQGHREGANGQAKRPIIPVKDEVYKKKIMDVYYSAVTAAIEKK